MTTLEYMQKQLRKHKLSCERAIERKAPEQDILNLNEKISHYEYVCELLKKEV
jgi:hypothetical protein